MRPKFNINMAQWPCVATTPNTIFGAKHVIQDITTARITNPDGTLYYGPNPLYVRTPKSDGTFIEEAGCDYNFRERMDYGHDGQICSTLRPMPEECVVRAFFKPEIGKVINIESPISGLCKARVLNFAEEYIQTDWAPKYGDSGALCWGEDDTFAGVVSTGVRGEDGNFVGSILTPPPQVADPILAGTIFLWPDQGPYTPEPAPVPTPEPAPVPTPEPVQETVQETVQDTEIPYEKPVEFFSVGAFIFATRGDGILYKLSPFTNTWETMPSVPSQTY
jgi:hypothetical protein